MTGFAKRSRCTSVSFTARTPSAHHRFSTLTVTGPVLRRHRLLLDADDLARQVARLVGRVDERDFDLLAAGLRQNLGQARASCSS